MAVFGITKGLMDRLSYGKKFAVIGTVFLVFAGFLLSLLVSNLNSQIAFNQKEIYGARYIKPVMTLLRSVQDARSHVHALEHGENGS